MAYAVLSKLWTLKQSGRLSLELADLAVDRCVWGKVVRFFLNGMTTDRDSGCPLSSSFSMRVKILRSFMAVASTVSFRSASPLLAMCS